MSPGALPAAAAGVDTGELIPGKDWKEEVAVPRGTKVPNMVPEGTQLVNPREKLPPNFDFLKTLKLMMPSSYNLVTPTKAKREPESWSPVKAARPAPMEGQTPGAASPV